MIKDSRLRIYKDKTVIVIFALITLILLAFFSLCIGTKFINIRDIVEVIQGIHNKNYFIVLQYRIPRMLVGILAGANLAISGAIFQSVLRNPLASTDVIGVTKGAGLATVIAIIVFSKKAIALIPIAGILGASSIAILIYILSKKSKFNNSEVALIGVALGALCDACIQFLTISNKGEIHTALVWLTGSLWGKYWNEVAIIFPFSIIFTTIAIMFSTKLDVINLGEDLAISLGENVILLRWTLLALATILAATAVSVIGTIGFIGLLSPHIARSLVGHKHKFMIPLSAIIGSLILTVADMIGRWVFAPVEVPVGIVTAIIGAPYFLYLLFRKNN